MGSILITRSPEQGQEFVGKHCLSAGLEIADFLFEPLIEIEQLNVNMPDLKNYDGVILTSSNACSAIPNDITCRQFHISESHPTASDIAKAILVESNDRGRRYLYIRGEDISFDMKGELEKVGHYVDELITYRAVAAQKFSDEFLAAVKNNEISVITFFSKRTAEIFVELAQVSNMINDLKTIKVLCISNRMIKCLHSVFDKNIEISATPDARSMARHLLCMVK